MSVKHGDEILMIVPSRVSNGQLITEPQLSKTIAYLDGPECLLHHVDCSPMAWVIDAIMALVNDAIFAPIPKHCDAFSSSSSVDRKRTNF
ncbi:hypothetical protein AXF42_Ash021379 [Apostasia shenzhenica]|uniref:Uncharacterized protein n=1 Tax=Apostasia shenzhenica TaxID=1088818 RepID=A0A2H9ZWE8_9ASPA|nr:hypothetical protein AXF42_Ash021379 [Apostasia shenzhenica]